MAHTPGPWHFEEDEELEYSFDTELFTGHSIIDGVLNQIAIIPTDQFDEKEFIANSRLLSASPDLLEVCIPFANEATLYLLENFTYRCACCNAEPQNVSACDFEHRSDCPVIKVREAIAKAEGKSA